MFFGQTEHGNYCTVLAKAALPALLALSPLLLTRKIVQLVPNSRFSLGIPDERYLSVGRKRRSRIASFPERSATGILNTDLL